MRFKSRTRALVGATAAATLGLAGLATMAPVADASIPGVERIGGANRNATAALIGEAGWCDPTAGGVCQDGITAIDDTFVIVNNANFPDALSASVLGRPILLVGQDSIPADTQATLNDMKAADIADGDTGSFSFYVVGGTGAVDDSVVGTLVGQGHTLLGRLAGANRVATSVAVASVAAPGDATVFLASAQGWADALAAGPGAFTNGSPILLTQPGALDSIVLDYLIDMNVENVVILGGTGAVSQAVEDALVDFNVTRVGGANRHVTSRLVADLFIDTTDEVDVVNGAELADVFGGLTATTIGLASSANFPDALAAGPFMGKMGGPLLLTPPDSLGADAEDFIGDNGTTGAYIFGGTAAVSSATESSALSAVTGSGTTALVWTEDANGTGAYSADTALGVAANDDIDLYSTFTIDGVSATLAEAKDALTVGDTVTTSGTTMAIVNGSPYSGMVGNVNTTGGTTATFDIITAGGNPFGAPVFGANPAFDIASPGATAYSVDGAADTGANFIKDISLGDMIVVSDGADGGTVADDVFALTNGTLTGLADKDDPAVGAFTINGLLGDIPEAGGAASDDRFIADGTKQTFTVDGSPALAGAFFAAMTDGDTLSYSRAADSEAFALTRAATTPAANASFTAHTANQTGGGADDLIQLYGGGRLFDFGAFGTVGAEVTPASGDTLTVYIDGALSDIDGVEAAIATGTADLAPWGLLVVYTDGGTSDTLEVTTSLESTTLKASQGAAFSNDNTANDTIDVSINGVVVYDELSTATQLSSATTPTLTYYVNGTAVAYAIFEDHLGAIDTKTGGDRIQVKVTATGTEYHLTSNETP